MQYGFADIDTETPRLFRLGDTSPTRVEGARAALREPGDADCRQLGDSNARLTSPP